MSGNNQDTSQWLSVTEETLFLHDGLIRVTDLVELPHDVNTVNEVDHEVVTFDSKSPAELSERLKTVCGTQNNAYARLLEYRLNALRGFWAAQQQIALDEQTERDGASHEETIALLKKQGLWKEAEPAPFSTRVSLLLVLPLLQSQSKFDPALCGITAQLLFNCLRDCQPLSLTKEPGDCLNGLETLLSTWLGEEEGQIGQVGAGVSDPIQLENAASALVALTCARGQQKTLIHTVHLLQRVKGLEKLPVADLLHKLVDMDGGQGQASAVLGTKHIVCWGYEDMLSAAEKESTNQQSGQPPSGQDKDKDKEIDVGRSVTCDGRFLYTTNATGKGVAKIGTGLHGTLRGYLYARNVDIPTGKVVWANGLLLHRPLSYDRETEGNPMAQVLDQHTLKPTKILPCPEDNVISGTMTTITICSDGAYIYWIWCLGSPTDKSSKGQNIFLDTFRVDANNLKIDPLRPRVCLQRKEDGNVKSLNETLLSRLRPYRSAASAATLVALGGNEVQTQRKEDNNTSCGLPLKTLVKTPIYCDGTSVVLLTPVPGSGNTGVARSLFGSGSSLASLRSLATNLCFNVEDGQFVSRSDLIDAPTCALARGAQVPGLGVCYDVTNNLIWTCSTDWIDQFFNQSHQARHHILRRLHIDPLHPPAYSGDEADVRVMVDVVIKQLLRHVGSMCIHQLHSDLLHTPLGSYILQQHPPDLAYMERVCDILQHALEEKDTQIVICALIIFQLIYKMSVFSKERPKECELLKRSKELIWKALDKHSDVKPDSAESDPRSIQHEACEAITASLHTLTQTERNSLLHRLLTRGGDSAGLEHLRDLILVDLSEQMHNQPLDSEQVSGLRLSDHLIHFTLRICVQESCNLLRRCQTTDRAEFERLLSSVPMASPCLRYLMALQSHLLRECILHQEIVETEDDNDNQIPQYQRTESLAQLQNRVLNLASRIFSGAYEILEVLLETCNSIIHSKDTDQEHWLGGLERVAKATILGHLLPVLLTAMTHEKLRCLPMADSLMPQLVQLVVLTSQAALLLKSQVQAIRNDRFLDVSADHDLSDLIGDLNLENVDLEEREEQGFLAGLKIPAPWATGKTIETIHPVRDNYKFKETVTIPGARCLYLRFDPRCTSQYDYDKVVIYAGPNTSSRKVAEYGGNTFGYGSRSVLGSGWPKDLVKVEGDTVTCTFEMRSGREHNTPDKAMWGFLITVRAQESAEEVSNGLPFLADLALGLSVLACTLLHILYQGPERTKEEEMCKHLLKSKLLQRCVWQDESGLEETPPVSPIPPGPNDFPIQEDAELNLPSSPRLKRLPRIRLPSEIIQRLRAMSERQAPQVRPSIKEVIRPEVLEEAVLSAALKHLSLTDTIQHISSHEQDRTPEYLLLRDVMGELYRRLYAMIRQLQTLAELEGRWRNELDDIRAGILMPHDVFFIDYHLIENKTKELACLCFLKDIEVDPSDLESAVNELREKLDSELALSPNGDSRPKMQKTAAVVAGLLERLNLLLHVTIAPEGSMGLTRSMSQMQEPNKPMASVMVRSDTDVLRCTPPYTRSLSAPLETLSGSLDDSVLDIMKLQRRRQAQRKGPHTLMSDLVDTDAPDRPAHVTLIEQLFSFIGSNPEQAVSCESFLSAARVRLRRSRTRQQALVHMKELLTAASRVGGATHLVAAVTSVLQHGPRVDELTCGGMTHDVQEAFAETMTSVVQLAARFPIACCNSIGLLCIIPYTRAEEKCLVRCGLVHLLDRLCSLNNYRGEAVNNTDNQSTRQQVSVMAWAGFQVLSNRCVMWETEDGAGIDELEHSGLARQVSTLLTNHLARATECSGNEAAGNEALQEVLSLLNDLARSRMGKAILSQPACVARLLSLLLDQRPSPKLVLIILQLCRVALPLMSTEDCDKVDLPSLGREIPGTSDPESDKPLKIASLLLAKLGDFLVPGGQPTVSSRRPSIDAMNSQNGGASGTDKDKEDRDVHDGRLSVFVHKREDQSSHEVIQPLLSSFRLGGGANMERVVRMEREMSKHGKAEASTEDAMSALRRAAKWAQMGLVVSTGPPLDGLQSDTSSNSDKKKTAVEVVCKEKNAELARTDPVRPFISGHVANSMAAEVIALLHSLLTAPETLAAQTWAAAVEKVMSKALSCLPLLLSSVEEVGSPRCQKDQVMAMAKQANAALAALGGFEETIKPGCSVQIMGPGLETSCLATVVSVSEQTGLATVQLLPATDSDFLPARYNDTVQVPVTRLKPPRNEPLPLHRLSMSESIVLAVQSLLLPQHSSSSPLAQPLPIHGSDANSMANQICRVVAEIRTRACKVLACHLRDLSFASAFIQHSSAAIDLLKSLAKDSRPGERSQMVEAQCQRLRMSYRDCAKPPPPPSKTLSRPVKEIVWDTSRSFPPVRACLFSHAMTGVTFLGDPGAGSGFPRGTVVFASQSVPQQAPSFYWELEICSFGDSPDESGPIISFGFMPTAEKKDGAWTNPVGTCLFHNNGRVVHYNGSSLLQWKSVRLDLSLNAGDIAGIGWERVGDGALLPGQTVKGIVYFTYNGRKLSGTLDDVAGGMWPVVHIQKKNTRIKANFGGRPFAYAEGLHHRNAADECHDVTQEIRDTFGALPFCMGSDSDSESTAATSLTTTDSSVELRTPPGPPCRTATAPKALREYNSDASLHYKLLPSYENFTLTGPDTRTQAANADDESDVEDGDGDEPTEDHYALLVKAWEQKVFPTIRRRFRNEAERKDGLEQIRGALQLGMTDIARQTVEFLYEENGGMPRDLHLPTIEDIREELAKFSIERVRKGTTVVIRTPNTGTTVIPKFAVRGMMKTFGLTGVVLDVDQTNELIQVETYLRSEGVLVRFWYPIEMLERPPAGYRKSSIVGHQMLDMSSILIHRELLGVESVLARMHCRTALLELISQCNSPAMGFPSCSTLGNAMAASAALLQELDVENLQLLSNELLSPPQPHGCVVPTSLLTAKSASQCLSAKTMCLSDALYDHSNRLREELRVAIARAANQGEDYLIELSNQICMCLQTAPELFPFEELPVTEVKVSTDIYFPGAAFLVVSCKADPKATRKDTSLYKSPWARIYTYRGSRVKKTGQPTKQEVVSYPRDTSSSSNQSDQYSPVIVPCDLIHVKVGVSPTPGIIVTVHALPPQFPLAVTYIETLVSQKYNFEHRHMENEPRASESEPSTSTTGSGSSSSAAAVPTTSASTGALGSDGSGSKEHGSTSPWRNFETVVIPPPVLLHVTELLGGYLWRTDVPALVKEHVFHLLAQCLRMFHHSESATSTSGANVSPLSPQLSPSLALLMQLQSELRKLYDDETKSWSTSSTVSGTGIGLGVGDSGRFTTYFHSLLEVCLAMAEVTAPIISSGLTSLSSIENAPATPTVGIPPVPTSPMSIGKRKKLKGKRERERGSTAPRRSGSPRRVSESDTVSTSPPTSASSSATSVSSAGSASSSASNVSISGGKPEDMLWFHRALTMSQILRYLTNGDVQGQGVTNDAIADAAQALMTPTVHSRLLVITSIPTHLEESVVTNAIRKACSASGGLFKDEIYLPTEEKTVFKAPAESKAGDETSSEGPSQDENKAEKETPKEEVITKRVIKGYAVIQIRSRTKVEVVKKALFRSKAVIDGMTLDPENPGDIPEEMMSVALVNQSLITEPLNKASAALEDFLFQKLVTANKETVELNDAVMIALTEIFHSCFISEQRLSFVEARHESGYICLGREQIMMQVPGNLLYTFLTAIRVAKKTFSEQVSYILRRYGIPKMMDKEDMDPKAAKGKFVKKSPKPSPKEKMALGTATSPRTTLRDKKPKPKEIGEKPSRDSSASDSLTKTSKEPVKEEEKLLTLDGFLSYVLDKIKQDVRALWRGLLACGFDLHLDRCACIDVCQAQQMCKQWNVERDSALVAYHNHLCQHLGITPSRLHPHEVYITDAELTSSEYNCLQGIPMESMRLRLALLQSLNNSLETFFLPLIDLRPTLGGAYSRSTAQLLASGRGLIFYDTKMVLLNRILNATAQRKPDQAAPEITLDPLENVGGERKTPMQTNLCQALRQLSSISSSQFNVRLAAGGDPTYSFNVRMTGEEVHGTSGSFRHFLWQVARELESNVLNLFMACPSAASHKNKGKYIIKPGPMTFAEEKLMQFVGQLLGITIRADIPLGLDLLAVLWKNLVGLDLDPVVDLQEADIVTYNTIKKFEMAENESDLQLIVADNYPHFVYTMLNGQEVELVPNGHKVTVSWENRQQYIDCIHSLRMSELRCVDRMVALRAGMASVIPIEFLPLLTPLDSELRTCGLPEVNLDFLKAHTMYQVGLMDTDPHIQYFWTALESFSQEDLRKFIKFACNQERVPLSCPCKDGGPDTAHVPPYPMKIAPPDGSGSPDSRYVRVETCMFMIKLPQYSSQQIMTERLLYAIHCREDPLSG